MTSDRPFIVMNDIPYTETDLDPIKALDETLSFSADDWGETRAMAWVYGIVCGWDSDGLEAMAELAAKFQWSDEQVARLRELHARFVDL